MRLLLTAILNGILFIPGSGRQDAAAIVKIADERMRGKTMEAVLEIKTVRPLWTRSMEVKTWMKGTDYTLILLTAPVKDKGIAFLKRKREVWNWMPALERVIKLPPSMMSQSWMGTDFTNDDLVKEASVVKDYVHSFIGDTVIDRRSCHIIQMIPKPDAPVVWGRVIVCIDKKDYLELHSRFYDEEGTLVNIMNGYDVRPMDGRLIPTRFEMIPAGKQHQRTELLYKSILFDRPLDESRFTTENMKTAY